MTGVGGGLVEVVGGRWFRREGGNKKKRNLTDVIVTVLTSSNRYNFLSTRNFISKTKLGKTSKYVLNKFRNPLLCMLVLPYTKPSTCTYYPFLHLPSPQIFYKLYTWIQCKQKQVSAREDWLIEKKISGMDQPWWSEYRKFTSKHTKTTKAYRV